ncbi:universal stress protein [Dialister sp.]|uniref:universal stress protein n=1 Tax=Dialister sp. TaxID=1955814 RepID=UPI002E80F994|nr:universal stress protein [Dialister sp.]MEE3453765.1 universal stress protein [Dialister sp.]
MSEKEVKKILVPVDSTKASARAFEYALGLAKLFDAEIHLLYVAPIAGITSSDYTIHMTKKPDDSSPLKLKGSAVLAGLMQNLPSGARVKSDILMGVPEVMITLTAKDDESDLIVMGTSGKGAISSMISGSVSYYTIHHVECPVLVVK